MNNRQINYFSKLVRLCRQKVKGAVSLPARRLTRFYPLPITFLLSNGIQVHYPLLFL